MEELSQKHTTLIVPLHSLYHYNIKNLTKMSNSHLSLLEKLHKYCYWLQITSYLNQNSSCHSFRHCTAYFQFWQYSRARIQQTQNRKASGIFRAFTAADTTAHSISGCVSGTHYTSRHNVDYIAFPIHTLLYYLCPHWACVDSKCSVFFYFLASW